MIHLHLFDFSSRLSRALLGVAILSLVASCSDSSSGESSSGGGSDNSIVALNAFTDFNCTSGWSNRDGALGLTAGAGSGSCKAAFPGGSGNYRVTVTIQTEFDGKPIYEVRMNGATIKRGAYPTSTSSLRCECEDWRINCPDKNVDIDAGIHQINTGDIIEFYGEEVYPCGPEHGAYAKWHRITLTPVN